MSNPFVSGSSSPDVQSPASEWLDCSLPMTEAGTDIPLLQKRTAPLVPGDLPANAGKRYSVFQPFSKVSMSWSNVSVSKSVRPGLVQRTWHRLKKEPLTETGERQTYVSDVTGAASAGEMLAIMGPKGAGKTTLLQALSGRLGAKLTLGGSIFLDKQLVDENIRRQTALIQFDDFLQGTMTVKEHLVFHALLRLDRLYSDAEKYALVEDVLFELDLLKVSSKRIGYPGDSPKKSLSLLERRLLIFATEILANPPVVLVDEPFRGFNKGSLEVDVLLDTLKTTAEKGKIVICSLEEPSVEILTRFRQVLLLDSNGRMVYSGRPPQLGAFAGAAGFPCPQLRDPSVHLLRLVSPDESLTRSQDMRKAQTLSQQYRASEAWYTLRHKLEVTTREAKNILPTPKKLARNSQYRQGWVKQVRMIMWRASLHLRRHRGALPTLAACYVAFGFFFGLAFDPQSASSVNGTLALLMIYAGLIPLCILNESFRTHHKDALRDMDESVYSPSAYLVASTLVDSGQWFVLSFMFITISYWLVGLVASAASFIMLCLLTFLTGQASSALTTLTAALMDRVSYFTPLAVASIIHAVSVALGGYFVNLQCIPIWIRGLSLLSWFRYAMEGAVVNQWATSDTASPEWINITNVQPGVVGHTISVAPFESGDKIIDSFNYSSGNLLLDSFMLLLLACWFRFLTFLYLCFRNAT